MVRVNHFLVIGGTGTVGRQVLSQLAPMAVHVRALVRNPSVARLPTQVEVVCGDLTVPESLDRCLDGIDAVFLVWTAPAPAIAPALKRIAKHARRIVLLSAPLKTAHPLFQQSNPLRVMFGQIEQLIETSGVEWTIVRPGMFAANALSWWAPQIRSGDVVTPEGVVRGDVAVAGETIAAIAAPGALSADTAKHLIDATGHIVMPGGIDPHVHLHHVWIKPDGTPLVTAGPEQVGRAALFGGTTSFIDFAYWRDGVSAFWRCPILNIQRSMPNTQRAIQHFRVGCWALGGRWALDVFI